MAHLFYTLVIALLMVSRLPVFSGKRVGKRVPPEMVLPVFVMVVLFFALLISYPWQVLTVGTVAYLGACRLAGCLIANTNARMRPLPRQRQPRPQPSIRRVSELAIRVRIGRRA